MKQIDVIAVSKMLTPAFLKEFRQEMLSSETAEEFLEKISFRSCTVSSLTQYVIAELLNSGSFERHINRVRRKRRREQK